MTLDIKGIVNKEKNEEKRKYEDMKAKLHSGFPKEEFPFVTTDRLQMVGYSSECKHCYQCGQLRSLCKNPKTKVNFCFWSWYTAGLVPDQLCPWYEANENWRSVSTDYFTNREVTIRGMIEKKLINEEIPQEAYGHNMVGEKLFKPVIVWVFGADSTISIDQLKKEIPWLEIGVGKKTIFRIPYEDDFSRAEKRILKLIPKAEGFGYTPNIFYQWDSPPKGFIEQCTLLIKEREDVHNVNIVTRLVHSERIQRNEIMNMTWLNRSIWAYKLKDKFKNKTILCIAGGPSLTEQLPLIKKHRDQLVVICVSTVAEILFKNDIIPDIIGTIDMKEDNKKYLEFLTKEQMENSYFLFEIDSHHKVVDAYKGPKIMLVADMLTTPITAVINNYLQMDKKDVIPKSGTVANMIYNFAKSTGPDEIWLAGYDLCYPQEKSHVDGMRLNKKIDIIDGNGGKFIKYEGTDHVDAAFEVPTNDDGTGYTPKAFKTYLTELNIRIKEYPVIKTIDLTPIGAKKEGAEYIPLTEMVTTLPEIKVDGLEILRQVDEKLFSNDIIKRIIQGATRGNKTREIKDIHKTKFTYLIRQYISNDILTHDSVINYLAQETHKTAKPELEKCVAEAMIKFKGEKK